MIELIDVRLKRGTFCLPKTSLSVPAATCGVVTGAAGAGKTSLVEAICGLQEIDAGVVKLNGRDVAGVAAADRGIGYLPQDVVLFPDMNVEANIGFGPKLQRWSKQKRRDRIAELASELQLEDLLRRQPHQLSGGQQKRVAMARAIALGPDIVCLDEPFVSLDEHSRTLIRGLLKRLLKQQSATVLVVTHQTQWVAGISDLEFRISVGVNELE
jgi:ABC-type sulfate/molybdate transport systems ATPase subunit